MLPGPHLPVRKAKPASIPSLFCSVSLLWGVAVSQIISPREPRPVSRLNCGVRQTPGGPGVTPWGQPTPSRGGLPPVIHPPLTWKRWVTTLMYAPSAATSMQRAKLA